MTGCLPLNLPLETADHAQQLLVRKLFGLPPVREFDQPAANLTVSHLRRDSVPEIEIHGFLSFLFPSSAKRKIVSSARASAVSVHPPQPFMSCSRSERTASAAD